MTVETAATRFGAHDELLAEIHHLGGTRPPTGSPEGQNTTCDGPLSS